MMIPVELPHREEERGVSILLRYKGIAVDDGTMDVYDAARNMMAFADYVVVATHEMYGRDVEVKAEVSAFNQGSFETDLIFQVVGLAATILSATPDVASVVNTVKESLGLFQFLRGEPPAKVEHNNDQTVTVTNNNGNMTVVQTESLTVVFNDKAALAAQKFVGEALAKPGVDKIEILSEGQIVVSANDNDAGFFHPIAAETPVIEQSLKMGLTIQEPSFKDGTSNRWTMWDGENSLQFTMEDPEFITRIDNGERFGKGDILVCDVRITQTKANNKLKIQRAILHVHSHQTGPEQSDFMRLLDG